MTDEEIDAQFPDVAEFWATPPRRARAPLPDANLARRAKEARAAVDADRAPAPSPPPLPAPDLSPAPDPAPSPALARQARRVSCLACGAEMDEPADAWRLCDACRADPGAAILLLEERLQALDVADAKDAAAWEATLDALDAQDRDAIVSAIAARDAAESRLAATLAGRRRTEDQASYAARLARAQAEAERWRRKFANTLANPANPRRHALVQHEALIAAMRARQAERAALQAAKAFLEDKIPF